MNPQHEAEKAKRLEALAAYKAKFGKEPSPTSMMDGKILERIAEAIRTGKEIPDEQNF